MFHAADKQFLAGLFFLLLMAFSAVPQSVAITFEPIYADAPGTGFYDETPLDEEHKALIHDNFGFSAETLGEARRIAFEFALALFEIWLVGDNTVRVEASFESREENWIAWGGPAGHYSVPGAEILFPVALLENISGEELNGSTEADVKTTFSETHDFYYGFSPELLVLEELLMSEGHEVADTFVLVAVHEIIHGLGFLSIVNPEDGSFPDGSPSIFDVNLYSERDGELLINLSDEQRLRAITSGTGLSWDGTSLGEHSYSCARLIGKVDEVRARGGIGPSGRPLLYTPNPYIPGSSVSHFHMTGNDDDIMAPSYAPLSFIDLTFGVLRDIGWRLKRDAGDDYSPFNVKDLLVSEVLEECTVATSETAGQESGGGCAVAEAESMPQNAIFNLFLVLSIMLSASLRRSREIPLSEKRQQFRGSLQGFFLREKMAAVKRFSRNA